jgi:enoyl-CoA hydratase/carnithine racemase
MSCIAWEKIDTVGLITLNQGENRFNPNFLNALMAALDAIEQEQDLGSVAIVSSDPKNWSLGIDLQWITEALGREDTEAIRRFLHELNGLFRRLLLYPLPVIATINGHAFGGGAIMACACDFRFMKADRGFFCFPEIDIRIPFLPGMLSIIGTAIPPYKVQEMVLTGKRTTAAELLAHHVVMAACENEASLRSEVLTFAKTFTKGRAIFAE